MDPAQAPSFHILHPEVFWDSLGCVFFLDKLFSWAKDYRKKKQVREFENSWSRIIAEDFFKKNFIVILLQLSQFSPFALLCPSHPLLPQSVPTLLSMSMSHSYMYFDQSLPLLSTLIHPFLHPSGHCQSVPCFHSCASVLFVSLFCSLDFFL